MVRMRTHPRISAVTVFLAMVLGMIGLSASGQTDRVPFSRRSDVIYGRRAGLALTMEVFTPSRPNRLGVVWVVSSSGKSSREQTLEPSFEQRVSPFLKHGYTVFAVIHGSAPAFNFQDFIDDARRAVRFIRQSAVSFGIDGQPLAIAGSSAGGAIALTIALQGDEGTRVQAAGAFFAPTDFLHYGSDSQTLLDVFRQRDIVDPSFQFFDANPKTGARTLIADPDRLARILSEVSPASHVTNDDPPTMLIHGTGDQNVPVQQSQRLIDQLKAVKVNARLVLREGMRHAWPGWEADSELIAQWFDDCLRPSFRQ